jgi:hypothetical protein
MQTEKRINVMREGKGQVGGREGEPVILPMIAKLPTQNRCNFKNI